MKLINRNNEINTSQNIVKSIISSSALTHAFVIAILVNLDVYWIIKIFSGFVSLLHFLNKKITVASLYYGGIQFNETFKTR
jgi:hypothetical protein